MARGSGLETRVNRSGWLAAAALLLAATGCDRSTAPGSQDAAPIAAREVAQPEGWADELAMPLAEDLNPDPNVLEVAIEARVADVEILPGVKTTAWTYNGGIP